MSKIIAITIGDHKGIGIHILLESWKNNQIKNFILFSNIDKISKLIKNKKIHKEINLLNNIDNYDIKKFNIYSYKASSAELNSYLSLKYAYEFCKKKKCMGVITLPLRKDLIASKINKNFIGHTEFFQKIDKKKHTNMILYHDKIIITPLTTHIEIKKISRIILNKKFLFNQIKNLNNTLKIDFNINKPKIIISGLNPHAGENGILGDEEKKSLIPTVRKLKKYGVDIDGPFSADSILIKKNLKAYDCFVFIFHDQALIPFKYISQFSGVNYTGNLDIIRTSPDHGTAYNLIGQKNINNNSFLNCYKLIKKIHINRKNNVKSKKIS